MEIDKKLCERLYAEVKNKLQTEFTKRGMTYRHAETSIWKAIHPKEEKTYFQLILEENTQLSFSSTFNNMYLWRKMNEVQTKTATNFQEDYLLIFVKFLGYSSIQGYVENNAVKLSDFLGLKENGKTLVIQPIFDDYPAKLHRGEKIQVEEQTVDSKDTESLLEIINLFHQAKIPLPERVYDRDIVSFAPTSFQLSMGKFNTAEIDCIIAIGFYSNHFTAWAFQEYIKQWVEYTETPAQFRVKHFNFNLGKKTWTDYYLNNAHFDGGFLLRAPIEIEGKQIMCFFICGIENKGTRAMTSYLCKQWAAIPTKKDSETGTYVADLPFLMVFRINKEDLRDIYCEKIIVLEQK